jgi:hypothetical protein
MWKPGQSRNPAGIPAWIRTWRTAPQCRYFLTALIDRIDVGANQISRLGLRLGEVMFDPCAVVFASPPTSARSNSSSRSHRIGQPEYRA